MKVGKTNSNKVHALLKPSQLQLNNTVRPKLIFIGALSQQEMKLYLEKDISYQGEALKVPTAF